MAKKATPADIINDDDIIIEEEETTSSTTAKPKKLRNTLLQKDELVAQLSERSGESKVAVSNVLGALPSVIIDTVSKDKPVLDEVKCVPLPGVGIFGFQFREASDRISHLKHQKQKDGAPVPEDDVPKIQHIPEHYSPSFRFSSRFRTVLSEVVIEQIKQAKAPAAAKESTTTKGSKKPA
jgi:nucleoid DNA-binding protein